MEIVKLLGSIQRKLPFLWGSKFVKISTYEETLHIEDACAMWLSGQPDILILESPNHIYVHDYRDEIPKGEDSRKFVRELLNEARPSRPVLHYFPGGLEARSSGELLSLDQL